MPYPGPGVLWRCASLAGSRQCQGSDHQGLPLRSPVNRTYCGMAAHYGSAVLPTRPRRPRDKAKVEAAVRIVERWLLGRLRHRIFYSLAEVMRRSANCFITSMTNESCAALASPAVNCSKSLIVRLCDHCLSNAIFLPNGVSGVSGWIYHVEIERH